jgi:hypothetical protein
LARLVRSLRCRNRKEESRMFGLGIIGTILLIVLILWLLDVF